MAITEANPIKPVQPEADLKAALDALEISVATPIVSGDFASWLGDVHQAWQEAATQIHFHANHLHSRQYEEIAAQNPELLPRIDLLKTEDAAVEQQRQQINQTVSLLAGHSQRLESDEGKATNHTKTLVDEISMFIVRVRRQGVVVQTWYGEAFNRDRGAVD